MVMRFSPFRAAALVALALAFIGHGPAAADAVADFYKGKTVTITVGSSPGGVHDIVARLVARYMGKYIPGTPNVVVKNMPGAGELNAVNYMYDVAPKDGTAIAIIGRAVPQLALLGNPNIRFDPDHFTWLGSTSSYANDAYCLFIMADRPIKSWKDLRQPGKKIVLGAVGPGSTNLTFALIAKDVLKLNIDVVRGYRGAAPIFLAMQNHEIDGQVAGLASTMAGQRALWDGKNLRALIQFGRTTRDKELPDVPTGRELLTSPDDLALLSFAESSFHIALPFLAPPDIPADRAKALRDAFSRTHEDPTFLAEAQKLRLDVSPIDGDAVAKVVHDMAVTPRSVIERFKLVSGMR